ncbi:hypothetical protein NE237_003945 [Protea cynaroides]|uniref:Pectate lyase n=1 Tax=Protea cynaroides TaxID=273540 RepID=A0A9Q0KID9_9MAGN|nr:hypothetical protein NE237_003945 [Protea cynaroides]
MECKNSSISYDPSLLFNIEEKNNSCFVDGTRCQYSQCAQGNKLQVCAFGFANGVTGGVAGPYYTVDKPDDDPTNPALGTLRFVVNYAGNNNGGAWITFKNSMHIILNDKLWVKSNTTIDGRGVNVTITGACLALRTVENVILHNFDVSSTGDSDTVHIFDGSHKVWVDHLTTNDGQLGLVTVVQGSTDVTISNSYLSNCSFNVLLGASDQDTIDNVLRVTVYRNWFDSAMQRMPHCRWGYCHVVNNYYRNWTYYCIGARAYAKVYSELNVFDPGSKLEVTPWFPNYNSDLTPTIVSSKDLLMNGSTFHQFLNPKVLLNNPQDQFPGYMVPTRPTNTLEDLVTKCSGALFGPKLSTCLAAP